MADYSSSAPAAAAASGGAAEYDDAGAASLDAEDERLLRNIGDHPLMERVQVALQKQLQQRYDRVEEELRDKREEASRTAAQREELGVELYSVQQQLAKLQMQLETTQQNATTVAEARRAAETDLEKFKEVRCAAQACWAQRCRRAHEIVGAGMFLTRTAAPPLAGFSAAQATD